MSIDADGAPNAYHPDNIGLDDLKNAGYPNTSWWKNISHLCKRVIILVPKTGF